MNEFPKDYRIDQIYIHALILNHKLVCSNDDDSIIVATYDPKYYSNPVDGLTHSSVWVRFRP